MNKVHFYGDNGSKDLGIVMMTSVPRVGESVLNNPNDLYVVSSVCAMFVNWVFREWQVILA